MNWIKNLFGKGTPKQKNSSTDATELMRTIMIVGDKGNAEDFPILKRAILTEGDNGVRFAALKRLHNFKHAEGFDQFLDELESSSSMRQLEPYYSMALVHCGRLSETEFAKRMNQ